MAKAIRVHATGGPEVLTYEDVDVGTPGEGQLRIRQTAIGVNFIDIYQRSGLYKMEMPFVAGQEAAGEVTAIGRGVDGFAVGDRVAYSGQNGGYAVERLLSTDRTVRIPDGIDDTVAAASMLKGTTAYYLTHLTWPLKAGETVLVHAAAGATGSLVAQWAQAKGVRVIGTVGSAEKVEIARHNGCDEVVNYRETEFAPRVRELTGGRGVDVVYDGVGRATFEAGLDCLRPRGLMVSFGNASGVVSIPDLTVLSRKGSLYVTRPTTTSYFAAAADYRVAANAVLAAIANGDLRPAINQTYALSDAAEAHRALEGRETVGATILIP